MSDDIVSRDDVLAYTVASQNDWGPLDILILWALT